MSIFQRKDRKMAWWVAVWRDGKRLHRRSPVQTLEGAVEFEMALRERKEGPDETLPLTGGSTYAEFAETWMERYVAVANRPATVLEKRVALRSRLLPAFGHLPLRAITTNLVDARVAQWMREGLSVKRINNLATVLRCSLRCAAEWGLVRDAPRIRHHRYMPPVPLFLSAAGGERLLAAMEPGFWRTLVLFMLRTGARFGEAAALRWEDLDLGAAPARVLIRRGVCHGIVADPKTNASRRSIALTPDLAVALKAHRYRRGDKCPWVFTSPTGRFYTPEKSCHFLKEACVKAGVPVVTWHKLRHSCASQLLAKGVPLVAVKELLGHTSIETTTIYTHIAPNLMWDYMKLLSPAPAPVPGCADSLIPPPGR